MTDLAAWLLDQIAEDDQIAEGVGLGSVPVWGDIGEFESSEDSGLVIRPSRVLAECAAKRQIVEYAENYSPELEHGDTGEYAFDLVVRLLALPYADRPGYDEAWRP